jgi:hypothetical protein
MKQSIDTNHSAEKAYQIIKTAYKQLGKLRQENNTELSLFGTSTYGLQTIKINISVESLGTNSVIHIEATSDDVFEKGAKTMLEKIIPAFEKALGDSNTDESTNSSNTTTTTKTNHNNQAENTSAITEGFKTENKTIRFSTGKLIINDTNISFHQERGNVNDVNTISRDNIGHMDKQAMRLLPKAEFVYIFRIALIGIALIVLGFIVGVGNNNYKMMYLGFVAIAFASFLMFCYYWIDGLFGVEITQSILLKFHGVDAYRIVVQNIFGGTNLMFLIRDEEVSKLPKLENYKMDKIHKVENVVNQNVNTNSLDDLKKLGDLYQGGILTKEEFEQKKTELLNK